MTLSEFFSERPRGSKMEMARKLEISKTWLSLVISGRKSPSPELSVAIERYTKGKVLRSFLRPDIFGDIR